MNQNLTRREHQKPREDSSKRRVQEDSSKRTTQEGISRRAAWEDSSKWTRDGWQMILMTSITCDRVSSEGV
jgi:hypothetical protein